jgi:DNA replication protein DnaC
MESDFMKGNINHYFPGGNTSKGFYSYYRYIMGQKEARRIICIKGGPGTGKSTLMKRIGEAFCKKGYDIEFHHCSSDNNSLDGVVIKGLNVVLLDGTAPHIVDPINPGTVDEILNLGQCWKEEGFKKYRNDIIKINKEVGRTFKRAYKYISAAKLIHDDWSSYNKEALNQSKINLLKQKLKNKIFKTEISNMGCDRHLFATAFTPNGIITFIDNLISDYQNIFVLNGEPGTGKNQLLNFIADEALMRGYYIEILHTPLIPEKFEHVLIPEMSTAVITSNEINQKKFKGNQIFMDNLLNTNSTNSKDKIAEDREDFYKLLNKGLSNLKEAKSLHDKLETYYIPNMDFEKIENVSISIINKINNYEKQYINK